LFLLCCGGIAHARERWILVTDSHLNPFDRHAVPASFGHDSNEALFESALEAMRKAEPNPQVVLVGGDFLAHQFPSKSRAAHGKGVADRDALDTIRAQATALDRAFPHARFAVTIGNNDDPCGDYRSEHDGEYMRALAAIWLPLIERGTRDPGLEKSFATGAYGVTPALHGNVRIISLNSVYWSFFYLGSCHIAPVSPGDMELAWLARTLAKTPQGVKNIVLMHIPPGPDAATTKGVRVVGVPFWHERYRRAISGLFADPRNALLWAVAGHTHRSDVRLVGGVPMLLAGALSPILRNEPTFSVLDVDDDGTLRDIHSYVFSESEGRWSEAPSFDHFWNVKAFTADALRDIHERLSNDPQLREQWAQRYADWGVGVDNIKPATWRIFWCAQTTGGDEFAKCAGAHRLSRIAIVAIFAIAAGVAVVVLIIAAVVLRRRRFSP
jgi:hypothetical protein